MRTSVSKCLRTTRIAAPLLAMLIVACAPSPRTHQLASLPAGLRVALLPLANYTQNREAPDKIAPILLAELAHRGGVHLAEPGAVEAVLSKEPWLLFDRIPPDLVNRFGDELGVDALLVGAVLGYGYRQFGSEQIPHVSISLRLIRAPGGVVLWSAVHSRDGDDNESVFGLGRVHSLEQLLTRTIAEIVEEFPAPVEPSRPQGDDERETGRRASTEDSASYRSMAIATSMRSQQIPVGASAAIAECAQRSLATESPEFVDDV